MKFRFSLLFLLVLFGVQFTTTAQTIFFSDNFENSTGWVTPSNAPVNDWVIADCENNGGTKAAYISSGGATNDCSPTGKDHYGYTNEPGGTESTILYQPINASCYQNIVIKYDLKVEGETGTDFFELVTSQDNGATWQVVTGGGPFDGMSSYTGQVVNLSAAFNQTSFYIGLRFTYNNANSSTAPASVDNFRMEGISLDVTSPVVVCPAGLTRGSDASCSYTVQNYAALINITDDCSTTFNTNQTPTVGTVLANGPQTVTFTAFDATGNQGQCTFILTVADTIAPVPVCPTSGTAYGNFLCSADVGNQFQFATATDNCSASNLITFSQSPSDTTNFIGQTTVTVFATDPAGNSGSCSFSVFIIDTIAPVVTCMSDTMMAGVTNPCNFTIPDLSATHSALDYCTPNNLLSFSQNPVAGTLVSGVQDVIITYIDTAGNSGTCITHVTANDTQAPTITCPSNQTVNVVTCNSTLPDLTAMAVSSDNCSSVTLTQSPVAGSILTTGHHIITLTSTDENGNSQTCTTTYAILENVNPQVTCPPNQVVCNPLINYASPSATDNCLFVMTQTDGSGFTDGDIFPVGITTQTYLVTDSSGNTASCSFTIQVQDYPDTAQVLNDTILLCNVFDTDIAAQPIQSGSGSWAVISGTGVLNNPTSLTPNISGLSLGENQVQWIVNSSNCGQKRDTVTIIVSDFPTPSNLPDTMLICTMDGAIVIGNVPTSGTGTWSSENNMLHFSNVNAPIVQVDSVPEGYSHIYWSIGTPSCPSSVDSSVVYRPISAQIFQVDTTICLEDLPFHMNGTPVGNGQFSSWATAQGFAGLSSTTTNNTTLTTADPGVILVVYRLTHPVCGQTTDTLAITINNCEDAFSDVPTVFTPNSDGKNDYFSLGNIHELHPDCEVVIVNRYGTVVFKSSGYATPWNGTFNDEPLPFGTYFYSVSSPSDEFETFTGSISIIR